jgi:AcrR family transcriptional regulator
VSIDEVMAHAGLTRGGFYNYFETKGDPLAIAGLCVGAMVVARSLENRELADSLRGAARNAALELGAWSDSKGKKLRGRRQPTTS